MDEEHHRKYVCSRGILKACAIHSAQPVSSINRVWAYDFSRGAAGGATTLYICLSALRDFICNHLPKLCVNIVLVTGDCDETCWTDVFATHADFVAFIERPQIIHWFSQNAVEDHPKLTRMPIGLDYHTMTRGVSAWGPQQTPGAQEAELEQIAAAAVPFWQRAPMCYANFQFLMTTKFGHDRQDALRLVPPHLVHYEPRPVHRAAAWRTQSQYGFVLSPHGNGLDCHRTWEALVLGCIPIVKTSKLDALYAGLPVLIVQSWAQVSAKLLQATLDDLKNKPFHPERLRLGHWVDLINSYTTPQYARSHSAAEMKDK
jgi:hypothetical protein